MLTFKASDGFAAVALLDSARVFLGSRSHFSPHSEVWSLVLLFFDPFLSPRVRIGLVSMSLTFFDLREKTM